MKVVGEVLTEVDSKVGFPESSVDVEILIVGMSPTGTDSQDTHYPGSQHLSFTLTQSLTVLSAV